MANYKDVVKNDVYCLNNKEAAARLLQIIDEVTANGFLNMDRVAVVETALNAAEFKGKCINRPYLMRQAIHQSIKAVNYPIFAEEED